MSFVPLQGPATLTVTHPPRDSEVEFTGGPGGARDRVVRLPMRGAIPVLSRALRADDAHPSVGLLGGATVLALKLVAAGRIRVSESGDAWEAGPLTSDDTDAVRRLAQARAFDGVDAAEAEARIRGLLDAVADTMTRTPPRVAAAAPAGPRSCTCRRRPPADLPADVVVSLRVEAPAEQLADGLLTVVLQVHDRDDPGHVTDAATLWEGSGHGFSRRARLSAGTELRRAAVAWPTLGRLLREPVPDRIVLTGDELADLLEHGVGALLAIGVDVFWPRGLQAQLEPRAEVDQVRGDSPLMTGLFGPEAMFAFDWRLALGTSPLTDAEMASLAAATTPIIRLRDNWVVIDPALARKARKRVSTGSATGTWKPVPPVAALRASLTGVLDIGGEELQVHPGASLLKVRDRVVDASTVAPLDPPPGLEATLRDYQLRGVTWLAELTGAGLGACLADDMGLGKTVTLIALHLHRRDRKLASGPTLVVCPASLLGNWEAEIRRFAPGVAVRRFHGSSRDLGVSTGSTTGAARPRRGVRAHDVRHDAPRPRDPGDGALGPGGRRRGPAHQERHLLHRAQPARDRLAGAGRAHRHAGGERPHRALGDPRLGHARAARLARGVPQGVGRADRVRGGPGQGAPVRAAGRAVPDAATQVRPRHRARAAAEDRDRPGGGPDPGAGGPLRGPGPGVDGADRARRRGQPGAGSCSPSSPA